MPDTPFKIVNILEVGTKVKMKDVPEFKRKIRVLNDITYLTFTVAVGTIGTIMEAHHHFYEVDWEGCPKVFQINNKVISKSKGWIVAKENIEVI